MSNNNDRRVTRHERGKASDAVNVNFTRAAEKGIPEIGVRNIITSALGFVPTEVDFRQILFKAKYATSDDGSMFYGMSFRPKKPKDKSAQSTAKDAQSVTLEGETVVTVKGAGHDFRSKAVKVIIFLSVLAGLFLVVKPF